ncbi:unnamed protein product [Nesidiocoris tenuis]|uniref:Uncharacterized protein n=1 Tax=Nesidiocoris tenuis TaxID=355587 RepID=A0A6H5GH20_9HEMI|nr:unnamed protein product [Nesidiocoris tenuis]CAB0001985.1 unnamed protein product [Nesidiocoris tenuis]
MCSSRTVDGCLGREQWFPPEAPIYCRKRDVNCCHTDLCNLSRRPATTNVPVGSYPATDSSDDTSQTPPSVLYPKEAPRPFPNLYPPSLNSPNSNQEEDGQGNGLRPLSPLNTELTPLTRLTQVIPC